MQFLAALYAAERPHWDNMHYAMDSAINAMGQAKKAFAEAEKNTNSEKPKEWNEEMVANIRRGTKKILSHDFMEFLDSHRYEGKMCLSNGECKNIEDAFVKGDWDMIGRYYNKYIQEPAKWSEEDEKMIKHIVVILSGLAPGHYDGKEKDKCITWLKALLENSRKSNDHKNL